MRPCKDSTGGGLGLVAEGKVGEEGENPESWLETTVGA